MSDALHSDGSGRRICSTCGEVYLPHTGHTCFPFHYAPSRGERFTEKLWTLFGALLAMTCLVVLGVLVWRWIGAVP